MARMNKKGFIQFLAFGVLIVLIIAFILGSKGLTLGKIMAITPAILPECNFGKATKGETFLFEDFSRAQSVVINQKTPPPIGWKLNDNSNSISFDAITGKQDCKLSSCKVVAVLGRGECMCGLGQENMLNRIGSYSAYGGGKAWDVFEYKLNVKQQPMQIDLINVHFKGSTRSDLGTIYDSWYIGDAQIKGSDVQFLNKIDIFTWGNGGDVADSDKNQNSDFSSDKIRFCIDPVRKRTVALTIYNGEIYSRLTDLSELNSDTWYLGMQGANGGMVKFLSFLPPEELAVYNTSMLELEILSVAGGESKSPAEVRSEMYVDDIIITPYNSPIEIPLPATQPIVEVPKEIQQAENVANEQPYVSKSLFERLVDFIKSFFSPLTNLVK